MRTQSFHLYFIEVKLDESHLFPAPEKGEVRHAIYDFIMLVLQHFEEKIIIIVSIKPN